jgi:hypothetical protein
MLAPLLQLSTFPELCGSHQIQKSVQNKLTNRNENQSTPTTRLSALIAPCFKEHNFE